MPRSLITSKILDNLESVLKSRKRKVYSATKTHIKKLRSELTNDKYNKTCNLLYSELAKELSELVLDKENLAFRKTHTYFYSDCPFFQESSFIEAFNRLTRAITVKNVNYDAMLLMVYHSIRFIYKITEGITHRDVVNYLSNMLIYVGQCGNTKQVMECMSDVFSAALGVQINNSSDLKDILNRYKKSPLYKSRGFDDQLLRLKKVYDRRVWDKDDQAIKLHHDQLINELLTLREIYIQHCLERKHDSKRYDLVMQRTIRMLQDINFNDDERYKKSNMLAVKRFNDFYENTCKKMFSTDRDKFVKFTKAVGAIMLTGLTYLSVAGAIYAHRRHIDVADFSKKKCGLNTRYSLSRYLTFKPTGALQEIKKISKSASKEVEDITKPYLIYK